MIILGIESSCDDTSVALLDCSEKGHFVIAEKTASQIEIHKKYGGVVPEIAGRMHAEKIVPLIEEILKDNPTPEAIAVTSGPGLITGLLVGAEAARTLSFVKNIPLVRVNHIDGHIHSTVIANTVKPSSLTTEIASSSSTPRNDILFPALVLIVSGGHTELILMKDHDEYKVLGKTKDDAAGECFDKVAKLLDLPYPGGPQISKLAETGNVKAIDFPRPMLQEPNYDFSFAGLKTSALYWLRDHSLLPVILSETKDPLNSTSRDSSATPQNDDVSTNDFCASIEQAIVDTLVGKTIKAAAEYKPKTLILAGGVAANKKLRETLRKNFSNLLVPDLKYCMDNAAMIAVAGYYKAQKNQYTNWRDLKVDPNWEIA